jgi:hypothetical protein
MPKRTERPDQTNDKTSGKKHQMQTTRVGKNVEIFTRSNGTVYALLRDKDGVRYWKQLR